MSNCLSCECIPFSHICCLFNYQSLVFSHFLFSYKKICYYTAVCMPCCPSIRILFGSYKTWKMMVITDVMIKWDLKEDVVQCCTYNQPFAAFLYFKRENKPQKSFRRSDKNEKRKRLSCSCCLAVLQFPRGPHMPCCVRITWSVNLDTHTKSLMRVFGRKLISQQEQQTLLYCWVISRRAAGDLLFVQYSSFWVILGPWVL